MDTLRPGAKPSGEEGLLRSLSVCRKEFMELKSSVKRELHEVQQVRASLIFFDYICLTVWLCNGEVLNSELKDLTNLFREEMQQLNDKMQNLVPWIAAS